MGRTCLAEGSTNLQNVMGITAGLGGTVGAMCWLVRWGGMERQWEVEGVASLLASIELWPFVTPPPPPLALPWL